jgi:hypothetical protein
LYAQVKEAYPALNGRLERAVNLTNHYHVRQLAPDVYAVTSANGRATYTVSWHTMLEDNPGWTCSCADVKNGAPLTDWYGGVQPTCKHIVAVGLAEMVSPDVMSEAETRRQQEIWEAMHPADDYGLKARW